MASVISQGSPPSLNTSLSLLVRVKDRDPVAWRQLAQLYSPLVYGWARRAGLQPSDAEDIVQNVFLSVASDIARFRRDRQGDSFRGWLWTICRHKILDLCRLREQQILAVGGTTAQYRLQQLTNPVVPPSDDLDDRCRLRHRAVALLQGHFEKHIWNSFLRTVVHGDHPVDVARDLGISLATVYRAKAQVLARLRSELEGL